MPGFAGGAAATGGWLACGAGACGAAGGCAVGGLAGELDLPGGAGAGGAAATGVGAGGLEFGFVEIRHQLQRLGGGFRLRGLVLGDFEEVQMLGDHRVRIILAQRHQRALQAFAMGRRSAARG